MCFERREIRALVKQVHAFMLLEFVDDQIGDGCQHDFPADLEQPVGDEHCHHLAGVPYAPKSERIKNQAIDTLTENGGADGAAP